MQAKSALCSRNESVPCGATPDGGAPTGGLLGYTCPREARPDMDPHYNQGVPQGLVCGDFGAANGDDTQNYCCSAQETTCAYNPVSICPQNTYSMLLTGAQEVPANDSPGTATDHGLVQRRREQRGGERIVLEPHVGRDGRPHSRPGGVRTERRRHRDAVRSVGRRHVGRRLGHAAP